jgi:hypothetical protein
MCALIELDTKERAPKARSEEVWLVRERERKKSGNCEELLKNE